ncbi:MAG: glycoside hydrolase family 3 C-terminal domain-containing protein [Clostridiales bacterium]|nr:glycoside hydrolase family 3 C-terminal domain-containing protein [Clostridiales bacterium]
MSGYRDPQLSVDDRVRDLLDRMTLEEMILQTDQYSSGEFTVRGMVEGIGRTLSVDREKLVSALGQNSAGSIQVHQMTPGQVNELQRYAVENTRLGIPFLFCEEALHGLSNPDATSFPQQIGLAATFDPALGRAMGRAIGTETRALGIHETFSPVMDLIRDPRYGRTEESYGEDTYLCSEFARETVIGLQGSDLSAPDCVASEPKHYVGYGAPIGGLNCASCAMGRHEVYSDALPVFEAAVADGGATNVMCSYNAIDGMPVAADHELLTDILRGKWGMRGFVRSDMTAVERLYSNHFMAETRKEAMAMGLEAGVDIQLFDFPHKEWQDGLKELVHSGRLDREVIRRACGRVLKMKFLLGLFERPYVDESRAGSFVHAPEYVALALRIARESITLLKNSGSMLPLDKNIPTIAVLGPCASRAVLGDYTPGGKDGISVLEGIRGAVSPSTRVLYDAGCKILGDAARLFPSGTLTDEEGKPGLTGRYYAGWDFTGDPVMTKNDHSIDFNWLMNGPPIPEERFCVRWTGCLTPAGSFDGMIGFRGQDSVRLYADGKLIVDAWGENDCADRLVPFRFEEGHSVSLTLEYRNDHKGARVVFGYDTAPEDFSRAVALAKQADVAIVCVGDDQDTCGENLDRVRLDLPGNQPEFVKAVATTGTPVVLVMQTGRPVTAAWEHEHIPAILQAWFPGEQGGIAVAETLFGDNNPSGRLPISFPRYVGQIPCHYCRFPGGATRYVETDWRPLYPFGYGLSYTQFSFGELSLSAGEIEPGDELAVSFSVSNTGDRAGVAVPQLYLRDMVSSVVKPKSKLAAFARVPLEAGETKRVTLQIRPREMRTLGPDFVWRIESGEYRVSLAYDSENTVMTRSFKVK